MKNFKKIELILLFTVFVSLGCKESNYDRETISPISEQIIEKFSITQIRNSKLKMILEAESAVINDENQMANLVLPTVKFYNNGEYVSTLVTERAIINMETCDIEGFGECDINTSNSANLQTTNLIYNASKELIYSDNPVEVIKPGQKIYGTSFESDVTLDNIVIKNQRTVIDKN